MLLAIDGTNWCHQLYHAHNGDGVIPALQTWVNAVCDFVRPSHAVLCFDRRSFRHDIFPGYKGARQEKSSELLTVLEEAETCDHAADAVVAVDGFEADDCLATIAKIGVDSNEKVVLASPDKDLRQCLIGGKVTILRKFSTWQGRLQKPEWYTAESLAREYKLLPAQWPSFQALVGDTTDNIAGCDGWGAITASKILAGYGDLAWCVANPWKLPITNKQRLALEAFRPKAELTLKLVTLRSDIGAIEIPVHT